MRTRNRKRMKNIINKSRNNVRNMIKTRSKQKRKGGGILWNDYFTDDVPINEQYKKYDLGSYDVDMMEYEANQNVSHEDMSNNNANWVRLKNESETRLEMFNIGYKHLLRIFNNVGLVKLNEIISMEYYLGLQDIHKSNNYLEKYKIYEMYKGLNKKIYELYDTLLNNGIEGKKLIMYYDDAVQGKTINCLMKMQDRAKYSDNIYYEFYIGREFINNLANIYPCFIKTYNVLTMSKSISKIIKANENGLSSGYDDVTRVEQSMKIYNPMDINDRKNQIELWSKSCTHDKELISGLQIEYVGNSLTLNQYLTNNYNAPKVIKQFYNVKNNPNILFSILYQIYYVLFELTGKFNHNDLNYGNVLLEMTEDWGGYYEFNYYLGEDMIKFYCPFKVKMVDYGHSYFKTKNNSTDKIMLDYICSLAKCGKNTCGAEYQYSVLGANDLYNVLMVLIKPREYSGYTDLLLLESLDDHMHILMKYGYVVNQSLHMTKEELDIHKEYIENKTKKYSNMVAVYYYKDYTEWIKMRYHSKDEIKNRVEFVKEHFTEIGNIFEALNALKDIITRKQMRDENGTSVINDPTNFKLMKTMEKYVEKYKDKYGDMEKYSGRINVQKIKTVSVFSNGMTYLE